MTHLKTALMAGLLLLLAPMAAGAEKPDDTLGKKWLLSLGGKLYDNQWVMLNQAPPKGRNPLYPAGADVAAANTWRCVFCHGWDYKGRKGQLRTLANTPRFVSLRGLRGKPQEDIASRILGKPHGWLGKSLPRPMLMALAFFISRGQHDVSRIIDAKGKALGNPLRGKDIFEGTCISCHQADGKAFIEGEDGDVPALGWVARYRPRQAIHKIRNGVPGADMLALRFLRLDQIADILAYLQTLDPHAAAKSETGD